MNPDFNLILVASVCVDGCVALAALLGFRRRGENAALRRIDLSRLLFALTVTTTFFVIKAAVLRFLGLHLFGIMNLVYVDLVAVAPLVSLATLWTCRRRTVGAATRLMTRWVRGFLILLLPAAPIGYYATFIEPFDLQVERAVVPIREPRIGNSPVKIGVFADLQTGRITSYERGAFDRLMGESPDLILIAGDIFQTQGRTFDDVFDDFHALFQRLSAPAGVYCVLGDVDSERRLRRLFAGTNVRLLVNEIEQIPFHDRMITLGGAELHFRSGAARRLVREMEQRPGPGDIRILLAHRPDVIEDLSPDSRIDLVVAGHTHGGQVVVPYFGPPVTLSSVPRSVARGGLHLMNDNAIYVTRGIGCERSQAPRIRLFCPPDVSILTVR